jgi:Uncharacterised nucleotidyltransferase
LSRSRPRGSFWPTPTQRALLEIALGPVDRAPGRWQALQPLDLAALETGSFGLLPLLYERLGDVAPDEPQLPRLFGTYRSIWYRNQLLLDRLTVLLPLLRQRAGVEPLLVGGVSALLRWYPRLGLRPVPQLELIVEPEAAAQAVKVSTYAGWRRVARVHSSTVLRDESGRVLVVHHGAPPGAVGPLGDSGLASLRERAVQLADVEEGPFVLDAADELLFTCAMGARTVAVQTCQWLVDMDRIFHSPGAPPIDVLVERARRFRLLAPVRAAVRYLAEIVDDDVMRENAIAFAAESLERRDRVAFALQGFPRGRVSAAAQILATYVQATADDPPLRAAAGLPRHLQERWGARSLAEVPLLALRKGLRRADSHSSWPDRNRSASS